MNRITKEVNSLQEFAPYLRNSQELYVLDDVLNAQYCFCMYFGEMETWVFKMNYQDFALKYGTFKGSVHQLAHLMKGDILFNDDKKQEELDLIKAQNQDATNFIDNSEINKFKTSGMVITEAEVITEVDLGAPQSLLDMLNAPEAEVIVDTIPQIAASKEFPIVEEKSLATLQSVSVSQQIDCPSEAQDHMECDMDAKEFQKLMSEMRKKLPEFDMHALSIDVSSSCKKFGDVKVVWNALNESGRIYIWEVSKILASSLLKNEAKEVKSIE